MSGRDQTDKNIYYDPSTRRLMCHGEWVIATLPHIKALLKKIAWPPSGDIIFEGKDIKKMDSAGAWLIHSWRNQLEQRGMTVQVEHFAPEHQDLLSLVEKRIEKETTSFPPPLIKLSWLSTIGKETLQQLQNCQAYLSFVGKLTMAFLRILPAPSHWRLPAVASVVYRTGYEALPIIALLSLMIGIVVTYQMGLLLRTYGANVFIVDLLGVSVLREFGPLITAIMVAGRTGSAFTAQLGIMKINQELDALDTIGVTPAELLLLPKIIGLLISLPLLIMWSDIFGVLGGMVTANHMLNISWHDFLQRFPTVIPLRALLIGLGKAPIFALIIATVGCYEGMRVRESANSLGKNTTRSVVLAIFFIIVADAIFSVIFSELKL